MTAILISRHSRLSIELGQAEVFVVPQSLLSYSACYLIALIGVYIDVRFERLSTFFSVETLPSATVRSVKPKLYKNQQIVF